MSDRPIEGTIRHPTAAEAIEEAVLWAEQGKRSWTNVVGDPGLCAIANAQTAQAWAAIALAIQAEEANGAR